MKSRRWPLWRPFVATKSGKCHGRLPNSQGPSHAQGRRLQVSFRIHKGVRHTGPFIYCHPAPRLAMHRARHSRAAVLAALPSSSAHRKYAAIGAASCLFAAGTTSYAACETDPGGAPQLPEAMRLGDGLNVAAPKYRTGRLASPTSKPASFVTLTNLATNSTVHVVGVHHLSPQS